MTDNGLDFPKDVLSKQHANFALRYSGVFPQTKSKIIPERLSHIHSIAFLTGYKLVGITALRFLNQIVFRGIYDI
jgi:hypothetical protein